MSLQSSVIAQPQRLKGKVAIITGGASGIGASAVRVFHENGAKVVIADIQDDLGESLAEKLGEDVTYTHCDVSKEEEVVSLIDTTVAQHRSLDIMYSNAGVIDRAYGGILDTTKADLDKVIGVNLLGAFWGAKHAARVMIPQCKGCILFTASVAASIAGLSTHSYAATKWGILGLTRSLAAELGEFGVRVNCVSPYSVMTGIAGGVDGGPTAQDVAGIERKFSELGNLKGKVLKAEDVARAALYLVSDEASYVSGLNLVVDGGFSVVNPNIINAHRFSGKHSV